MRQIGFPWTLLIVVVAALVPLLGSRYYTFLATDIVIFAMFATSLNLLVGVTGLVSFGHAAYFGLGAYICAIAMKAFGVPFLVAWLATGFAVAVLAAAFGYFCVRLTRIYFSMLTLAFAQIVWAICFVWNDITGGEQGYSNVPMPAMDFLDLVPGLAGLRTSDKFYLVVLSLCGVSIALMRRIVNSSFGRILTSIRDNAERTEFIGIDVRRYQLIVFTIAGGFAGLAGALFGILNRGVFPDFAYWPKSAEVLIMTILGGLHQFWGPSIGAALLIGLNQLVVSRTEYWPLTLGMILLLILFVFPSGVAGAIAAVVARLSGRRNA